ncbi:MAG TPA: ComEC/Rec2 family competence protein [Mycobacterium sp.]|nr:ComEC/Rec2 family competence protein [Mycobacterium sp.]
MTRVDTRLVPAALTCWAVSAIAIVWRAGAAAAAICALAAAGAAVVGWRTRSPGAERSDGGNLRRDKPVPAMVSAVVLGAAVIGAGFGWAAAVRVSALEHHPLVALYGRSTVVTVTASEQPRPVRGGGRVVFRGALRRIGGDDASGRVTVFAPAPGFAELTPGRPASFRAVVARPTRRDLSVAVLSASGAPTFGEASPVQRAAESVRRRFADAARSQLPADQAAALPALVLGDTSTLPPETVAAFRSAGLTHLTAVSGANVTIVCGAVLLTARLVGPRVAVALATLALVGFVIVVQPSASVLRAAVMGAIGLLGVLTHRRRHAMPALSATVIALMIVAPEMSVDLGFALSVSATAALIVIAPVWSRGLVARGWPKPVADAVCVATAAQLVTAPLIAAISGRVTVVSIAANVAVTAVIPPITVAGTAAAALAPLWPGGAHLLIRFTGPELWWLLNTARWGGGIPGATVEVPSRLSGVVLVTAGALAAVALWRIVARWRRRRRRPVARSSGEL